MCLALENVFSMIFKLHLNWYWSTQVLPINKNCKLVVIKQLYIYLSFSAILSVSWQIDPKVYFHLCNVFPIIIWSCFNEQYISGLNTKEMPIKEKKSITNMYTLSRLRKQQCYL